MQPINKESATAILASVAEAGGGPNHSLLPQVLNALDLSYLQSDQVLEVLIAIQAGNQISESKQPNTPHIIRGRPSLPQRWSHIIIYLLKSLTCHKQLLNNSK